MILLSEEFVGHGASVTCLAIGQKSGQVMVTGGEDKKVNLWAIGKTGAIMVCELICLFASVYCLIMIFIRQLYDCFLSREFLSYITPSCCEQSFS